MVMQALSAVFWGLILLSFLVFIHEGGHYVVARAFGVRVTEFFLGLPSRFKISIKSKRRGTEFGVTPLLLGGYNRICGMEDIHDDLLASAFAIVQREGRVSVEKLAEELGCDIGRAYTLLTGLTDLAAIQPYYDPELGEYPTQRDYPASFETLARDANMLTEYDAGHDFTQPGSTAAAEPRPLDDAEAQLAREVSHTYEGCSFAKRMLILIAGPLTNLVLAFVLVTGAYMSVEYQSVKNVNILGEVSEGSLAEAAGLKAGDELVKIDGTEVSDWVGIADALDAARTAGSDFTIDYIRDGVSHTTTIDLPEGETVESIGVVATLEPYRLSLAEAANATLGYAAMVGSTIVRLFIPQHTMEVLDNSSSIVGISVMASQAVQSGLLDVLALMAAVSMSLGFMNLLPIPPLDGGKMLIEIIQAVIRRPVSMKVRTAISYVGIAFFVFVFVVVVRNDVLRFVLG